MEDIQARALEEKLKSQLSQLEFEHAVFERMVYKNKNQHRRSSYFQYLEKVRRELRLLRTANMEEILRSCFHVITSGRISKQKLHVLESLKLRKSDTGKPNILERLRGALRLLSQMTEPILKAASGLSIVLARGFFVPFSMTFLAMLARLRVLIQQVLLDAVSVFNAVKIAQDGVEVFREFYPKGEECITLLDCVWKTDNYVLLETLQNCESSKPIEDAATRDSLESYGFLGFDPIDKQSKALFMAYPGGPDEHRILTVGAENASWRKIECPLLHYNLSAGICINGVLYYLGDHTGYADDHAPYFVIACFDVRSEEFKFVKAECCYDQLINYKGKLGGISLEYTGDGEFPLKLSLWVLVDVEKQEWSKDVYTLWDENEVRNVEHTNLSVVGMTATGDIVLCRDYTSNPFYVFYFNPERKTLQRVEIQGVGDSHQEFNFHEVYAFVDHVEDLNVIDAKHLKSSPVTKPRTKPHKRPCSCGKQAAGNPT